MFYVPIKAATYKVTSSNSTLKDRQANAQHAMQFVDVNSPESQSMETTVTWDGTERRGGEERRLENGVPQARLDARNKNDRRASRLSIAI